MTGDRAEIVATNLAAFPRLANRGLADELGVDLTSVNGTGAGGRVTFADIRAAAGLPRTAPAAPAGPAGTGRVQHFEAAPLSGPMSRNPLVSAAREQNPTAVLNAAAREPMPTLFSGGDLPAFTASGIPPQALLRVPWNARHAMAQAPTPAGAYRIAEAFAGVPEQDAEYTAVMQGYANAEGAQQYALRVRAWLAAGLTEDGLHDELFGTIDAAAQRRGEGPDPRYAGPGQ